MAAMISVISMGGGEEKRKLTIRHFPQMPLERDASRIVVPVAHREHARLMTVLSRVWHATSGHTVIRADELAAFYRRSAEEAFAHLFAHDSRHPVAWMYRDSDTGSDRVATGELALIGSPEAIQRALVENTLEATGALPAYLVPAGCDGVWANVTPATNGSSTDVVARLRPMLIHVEAQYAQAAIPAS
jgi:hypothetical protein